MTTRQEKLLVIRLGAGTLHTSDHQREYVRLSATGLVDRQPSFLHANAVSLTERGKEARARFTVELLDMLRSQMPAHDEFQRVRNKSKKPCHCGECWAVRENDRAFRQKARIGLLSASERIVKLKFTSTDLQTDLTTLAQRWSLCEGSSHLRDTKRAIEAEEAASGTAHFTRENTDRGRDVARVLEPIK